MAKQQLGSSVICQVGLIVRDIDKAVTAYSKVFGLPVPEIRITDTYDLAKTRYKEKATEARAKLAFFDMGQVSLELIEPVGGPSTWQEFLDEKGEGVHHIAFRVQDTDDVVSFLEDEGIPLVQQGFYTGGMYSYMDSATKLGVVLELLEDLPAE
jgi:methylmalonyl-CoA/ethylmalonyl-CoA epimerase